MNKILNYIVLEYDVNSKETPSLYSYFGPKIPCGAIYYVFVVLGSIESDTYEYKNEDGYSRYDYFSKVGQCPFFGSRDSVVIECFEDGNCYIYEESQDFDLSKDIRLQVNDKNSFKIDQLNFAEILKQWRLVLEEDPQYLLFWYDEQNKVYLECFEDEDSMRNRVDEVKRVVGEEGTEY